MRASRAILNVATGVVGGAVIYFADPLGTSAVFVASLTAVTIIFLLTFRGKIAGVLRRLSDLMDEPSDEYQPVTSGPDQPSGETMTQNGLESEDGFVENNESSDSPSVDFEFHAALSDMGIVTGTRHLEDSKYEPESVMKQTESELSFLGCFGTKWVAEGANRVVFEDMLKRVESRPEENESQVRFLLLAPSGSGFEEHRSKLQHPIGAATSHYEFYIDFVEKYDCFQVRAYNSLPRFRLIFTSEYTAFSPYSYASESQADSKQGWHNPHLEIDPNKRNELHLAFKHYYETMWNQAKPLSEVATVVD